MSQSRRLTVAVVLGLVVGALALPAAASAAVLQKGAGTSCAGFGTWTFLNNQTGGAAAGSFQFTFADENGVQFTFGRSPSEVNNGTQKATVIMTPELTSSWTLVSASTNLPGKLILASFECVPLG